MACSILNMTANSQTFWYTLTIVHKKKKNYWEICNSVTESWFIFYQYYLVLRFQHTRYFFLRWQRPHLNSVSNFVFAIIEKQIWPSIQLGNAWQLADNNMTMTLVPLNNRVPSSDTISRLELELIWASLLYCNFPCNHFVSVQTGLKRESHNKQTKREPAQTAAADLLPNAC